MKFNFTTQGTCSRQIDFEIVDNKIRNVEFTGGCNGNLKGISSLVEGMDPTSAIEKLSGIECGHRGTSCPDQLARALRLALEQLP